MVDSKIIEQIETDFNFILKKDKIKGVILYGSYLTDDQTTRSDIDICIVAPNLDLYQVHKFVYHHLENHLDQYDIRFFEELPLYIQGEIIENGKVVITRNSGDLSEYFHPYLKQWIHEKWRIQHIA